MVKQVFYSACCCIFLSLTSYATESEQDDSNNALDKDFLEFIADFDENDENEPVFQVKSSENSPKQEKSDD